MKQILLPNRYLMVPRTLIFLRREDEILLIKGAEDKKIWPGLYNGIGGHVERGEDLISAANRELFEETGIAGANLQLRGIIFIDVNENSGITMYVFDGVVETTNIKNSPEGTLEWINIKDLNNYPLVEDLYQLIPIIISNDEKIIFGRYYYENNKLIMELTE